MADLFIIGQFEGVASTTAVSVGSQVMHMLTVMIVGLAMGTTVCVGQAVGGGNRKQAAKEIGHTVTLFMAPDCFCHVNPCRGGGRDGAVLNGLPDRDPVYHGL